MCTCCDGISVETPVLVNNRPGLNAIAYRVGTQPTFKQSLLAQLATGGPALRPLTTRRDDDLTIGLLDAWATMADVLTFYQERIANESYLRTATERLSVGELARLIGYELQPGVAASTYLAFTLDDPSAAFTPQLIPGTAHSGPTDHPAVPIPVQTRVQSLPAPGEDPQTFETVEAIEGRADWNAMRPRPTRPQPLAPDMATLLLSGTTPGIRVGDVILINRTRLRKVLKISTGNDAKTTRIDFAAAVPPPFFIPLALPAATFSTIGIQPFTTSTPALLRSSIWRESDLAALSTVNRWSLQAMTVTLAAPTPPPPIQPENGAYVFRKKAAFFGYNAQKKVTYKDDKTPKDPVDWAEWDSVENSTSIFLDSPYDEVLPGSLMAIQRADETLESVPAARFLSVQQADSATRSAYGLSSKTTRLTVPGDWRSLIANPLSTLGPLRNVTIHAQSEPLPLAELPIEDPVAGHTLTLDRYYPGLKTGQHIILIGLRTDLPGVWASEAVALKEVTVADGFSTLEFGQSLTYSYVRSSVTVNGNVALATHGETVQESLGNGNASAVFQRFMLRQSPLTYVSSASVSGTATTLTVRVNDVRWHEVPSLLDAGPHDRVYTTHLDDEGRTTVLFGDGITGARLPTGQENVRATYRKGIGLGGLVRANQLSQLTIRPLGVKGANNPIAAAGAADRESLAEARQNAPLQVLTLGRVVSLQDYADFARAFAGIGKATATWTWLGQQRGIFVTVAGAGGAIVKADSPLNTNLLTELRAAGDANVGLRVASYVPTFFQLTANVQVHPDYTTDTVFPAIEAALRVRFSFAARAFGQPVVYSDVIATIQAVAGVVAVELDAFFRTDSATGSATTELPRLLEAQLPQPGSVAPQPAELLTLDPRPVTLRALA